MRYPTVAQERAKLMEASNPGAPSRAVPGLYELPPGVSGLFDDTLANPEGPVGVIDPAASDKTKALVERLEKEVLALQNSDNYKAWLNTLAKFHSYSMGNVLLIAIQKKDATRVAGFNTWRDLGRYVKKGEKGIAILAPVTFARETPKPEQQESETAEDFGKRLEAWEHQKGTAVRFRVVYVFDISQTEGKELPSFKVERVGGDDLEPLFYKLAEYADSRGLKVDQAPKDSHAEGYWSPKEHLIWVKPGQSWNSKVNVILHELTHERLQHQHGYQQSRGAAETQAESVAYVVGKHYGFDTEVTSFGYVATWAEKPEELKAALRVVQETADGMIKDIGEWEKGRAGKVPVGASANPLPVVHGPWDMSEPDFIAYWRDKLARYKGKRILFLTDGTEGFVVKEQKDGRLTAPIDEILARLHQEMANRGQVKARKGWASNPGASVRTFIDEINRYDDEHKWFWVAGVAKDAWPVLKDHLDELRPTARIAVEHYMEEGKAMKATKQGKRRNPMPEAKCPNCGGTFPQGEYGVGKCGGCGAQVSVQPGPDDYTPQKELATWISPTPNKGGEVIESALTNPEKRVTVKSIVAPQGYGVIVRGVSGAETVWFASRPTANRVRRALIEYVKQGGWTGAATISAFSRYAAEQKGTRAKETAESFIREYRSRRNPTFGEMQADSITDFPDAPAPGQDLESTSTPEGFDITEGTVETKPATSDAAPSAYQGSLHEYIRGVRGVKGNPSNGAYRVQVMGRRFPPSREGGGVFSTYTEAKARAQDVMRTSRAKWRHLPIGHRAYETSDAKVLDVWVTSDSMVRIVYDALLENPQPTEVSGMRRGKKNPQVVVEVRVSPAEANGWRAETVRVGESAKGKGISVGRITSVWKPTKKEAVNSAQKMAHDLGISTREINVYGDPHGTRKNPQTPSPNSIPYQTPDAANRGEIDAKPQMYNVNGSIIFRNPSDTGIRELDEAKNWYSDPTGLVGVRKGGQYHWYRYDEKSGKYQEAGTTRSRGVATSHRIRLVTDARGLGRALEAWVGSKREAEAMATKWQKQKLCRAVKLFARQSPRAPYHLVGYN